MSQPSLNTLLKQTSRSFYLTLRVLPGRIRPQIGLAYLLARTTDTIADTEIVPVAQRLEALRQLRERVLGTSRATLHFGALAQQQGMPAERMLLERVEESLAVLGTLAEPDLKFVRKVLDTITGGQELDLQRFELNKTPGLIALQHETELDDYTYRVAGCVGEFWTEMCRRHLFAPGPVHEAVFLTEGIRFGKGLQLVNILRDLPADLRKGRCYLPAQSLAAIGMQPEDLLAEANEARFRPLYHRYLALAESHLAAGWHYTNTIPQRHMRLRLACAWPILIGLKTIEQLRAVNILASERRVKVSRTEVRNILLCSVLRYPFSASWAKLAKFPG